MNKLDTTTFQAILQRHYIEHGRHDLPWRIAEGDGTFDPYKILVSELMLQQTQVSRVIPKYYAFLRKFPTASTLADASLGEVLQLWTGLGYNRRAKYLWQAAQLLTNDFGSNIPHEIAQLTHLPGVGKNTAGAIKAYAFNEPVLFIETNVRTVYIHHFFNEGEVVSDSELLPLLEETLDRANPREFYWALMDYGSFLKQAVGNVARRSKHFSRQSPFAGSARQIRGAVIRYLAAGPKTEPELSRLITDDRLPAVLADLVQEDMVTSENDRYRLA